MDIPVYVPPLKQEIGKTQKSKSKTVESNPVESNPVESQKVDMKRALTRAEADEQRFTTAIRWIVEVKSKLLGLNDLFLSRLMPI